MLLTVDNVKAFPVLNQSKSLWAMMKHLIYYSFNIIFKILTFNVLSFEQNMKKCPMIKDRLHGVFLKAVLID